MRSHSSLYGRTLQQHFHAYHIKYLDETRVQNYIGRGKDLDTKPQSYAVRKQSRNAAVAVESLSPGPGASLDPLVICQFPRRRAKKKSRKNLALSLPVDDNKYQVPFEWLIKRLLQLNQDERHKKIYICTYMQVSMDFEIFMAFLSLFEEAAPTICLDISTTVL